MRRRLLAALLLTACATAPAPAPPSQDWAARYAADHPLAGRIWSPARDTFVDRPTLLATLRDAPVVVLGERHDHPDHHRLQAALADALLASGRFTTLAFEMLDATDAPALQPGMRPDAVAKAVDWKSSGWPPFELYQPLFAVAHLRNARLVAAHPSKETVREGIDAHRADLPLAPLPPDAEASLAAEIRDGHCGMLPDAAIPPMAAAQRLKDAWMARSIGAGTILVTGNGHARVDRGVPLYLQRLGTRAVSVAFLEVGPADPAAYGPLPYDFVWFTPRVDDVDPCERFREQLERLRDRPM